MTDLHTDGNSVAGLLSEILAVDATTVVRRCHLCGDEQAMGAHRAHRGAGIALRCPSCHGLAVRIGLADDELVVELRGTFRVAVGSGA
jgi:hypothetical protein